MDAREPPTRDLPPAGEPEFEDEPAGLEPHTIMAASLGSVLGAMVSSRFGLAGTMLGAALAPVFVLLSVQALGPQIRRGIRRSRGLTPDWSRAEPRNWRWAASHPRDFAGRLTRLRRRQVGLAVAAAAVAFALGMIALTAIESIVGRPLSGIARNGASGGTTLDPGRDERKVQAPTTTVPEEAEPEKTTTEERKPPPDKARTTPTQPPPATQTEPPPTVPPVPTVPVP